VDAGRVARGEPLGPVLLVTQPFTHAVAEHMRRGRQQIAGDSFSAERPRARTFSPAASNRSEIRPPMWPLAPITATIWTSSLQQQFKLVTGANGSAKVRGWPPRLLGMRYAVLFTPPERETEIRVLTPFPAVFLAQRGATLGDRMYGGMRDLLGFGFEAVVMIGSDLPTLPSVHVSAALDILARRPDALVLGPAEDGGYSLIGVTRSHPQLFERIPWGTSQVCSNTPAKPRKRLG